ncbi:PEP-CTERM sorting domain-containing protein [Roseiconus lacunae]|uniref:PEP-CTERM sorting domain-containing protein n=1 Tax=Roseiconus lacunae TaxID=2605694 RepID=UPI001E657647|nr:PEP-CTERM sorting domain-containing protein [Roseiconus lacunae]MCD0459840.1 PEP-CTERM sorting domain-containing protein [Roseiconus lacunae]
MKLSVKVFALGAALFVANPAKGDIVLFEDFEDSTVGYSLGDDTQSSDGGFDFFGRVPEISIGAGVQYGNIQGTGYFAAMDIDAPDVGSGDPNAGDDATISWSNLDISGLSNLQFSGFFAEDDDGDNQDWDQTDSVVIRYRIDGGSFVNLLAFEAAADTDQFNSEPLVDTDFDGIGDGTALTSDFAQFTAVIGGTGSTLDLEIFITNLDSGDEDIAFDNITIESITAIPEPSSLIALCGIGAFTAVRRRRK